MTSWPPTISIGVLLPTNANLHTKYEVHQSNFFFFKVVLVLDTVHLIYKIWRSSTMHLWSLILFTSCYRHRITHTHRPSPSKRCIENGSPRKFPKQINLYVAERLRFSANFADVRFIPFPRSRTSNKWRVLIKLWSGDGQFYGMGNARKGYLGKGSLGKIFQRP